MKITERRWPVLILTAALLAFFIGCGSNDSTPVRGNVVKVELSYAHPAQNLLSALQRPVHDLGQDQAQDSAYSTWLEAWTYLWNQLAPEFMLDVQGQKVTYTTINAAGQRITVTGLLVIPKSKTGNSISAPIISIQHPTQVPRDKPPSVTEFDDPDMTGRIAAAFAATGFIAVAADYPGLGDNTDPQPYCHASLAYSVVDLIRAARSIIQTQQNAITWDGRIFLIGYSEGGYATMVTAKEIQMNCVGEFKVSAAAPLDGPYSLSDVMRNALLNAGPNYLAPFFLPYIVAGYESVY
ncbi:MAG: hypothetical protein HQK57_02180, partial [Deltaproteobacteria bacterium]|nr:hypothetical protein [Deltaproteobacteria bacterium]